ncbi:MAG TPA: hypothetical protein K8U77_00260 [Slackia equolifaciens]|uniref:Uncharacterized protein n=1 Tax=Slackia equolifaciens TaxID=498718 RepID=A0A9D2UV06_9ACTN|nr:hypothetical protein [Slackia equolifaciens]
MATESFFKTFRSTPEGWLQVAQDMMSDEPSRIQQEILSMPHNTVRAGKDVSFEELFEEFGSKAVSHASR